MSINIVHIQRIRTDSRALSHTARFPRRTLSESIHSLRMPSASTGRRDSIARMGRIPDQAVLSSGSAQSRSA